MSGIAGVIGGNADTATVQRMIGALRHRGPDEEGVWFEQGAGLGHALLSTRERSAAGRQPMELGPLIAVFDGNIYNYGELRAGLDSLLGTNSDVEVLLHLYRQHGDRCVERLRGMFAFAIWDRSCHRLFAARDQLGIKPLHYVMRGGTLAFASELGALKSTDGETIDRTAVFDYMTYGYVPAPKTIYRGMHKLPPANSMVLEDGRLRVQRYWTASMNATIGDIRVAAEQLDALLREIVGWQFVPDVPTGIFLSGGIDSAILAYYAGRVPTFTLGKDNSAKSEIAAARRVATHLGTDHHEIVANPADLRTAVDTVARCFGEPFADNAAWSNFLIARLAREHVTVALSGEGGDEMFGRYDKRWKLQRDRPGSRAVLARILSHVLPPTSKHARSLFRRADTGIAAAGARTAGLVVPALNALLDPSLLDPDYDRLWSLRPFWRDDLHPAKRLSWLDLHSELPDRQLTKLDRTSMAHSLEVRPPLLDHRLVEFAFSLSPALLVNPSAGLGKLVPRELMKARLPPGHLDRPKSGFGLPVRRWIAEDDAYVAQAARTLMDAKILRKPFEPDFDRAWLMLVLARWLQVNG
jgi:asparagine synthase (glutamine-hydrolysing)